MEKLNKMMNRETEILEVSGGFMVDYFNFNLKDRSILIGETKEEAVQKCIDFFEKIGDTDGTDN
jgi:hypothetical protein